MKKYPKLNNDRNCKYPERETCNYDVSANEYSDRKYQRCEYMKYDNNESPFSENRWKCKYKKP
jgi:hypothetical protein